MHGRLSLGKDLTSWLEDPFQGCWSLGNILKRFLQLIWTVLGIRNSCIFPSLAPTGIPLHFLMWWLLCKPPWPSRTTTTQAQSALLCSGQVLWQREMENHPQVLALRPRAWTAAPGLAPVPGLRAGIHTVPATTLPCTMLRCLLLTGQGVNTMVPCTALPTRSC
jgi:hypothetical protein